MGFLGVRLDIEKNYLSIISGCRLTLLGSIRKSMKILKTVFFAPILLCVLSCSDENESYTEFLRFPSEYKIISQTFNVPPILFEPVTLMLFGNNVVIVDNKSEFIFHLFDANELNLIGSFIRRGRGPNEEQEFFNPYMRKVSDNSIVYQTPTNIKTVSFTSGKDSLYISKAFEFFDNIINFQRVFLINGVFYGYSGELGLSTEFHFFDSKKKEIVEFGTGLGPYMEDGVSLEFENKGITVKPDETFFAASYLYFPIIRIFNSSTGLVSSETRYENNFDFSNSIKGKCTSNGQENHPIFFYQLIHSTQNYIYALYNGNAPSVSEKTLDRSNIIHVFDWNGNPVKKLILDHEIFDFDVSDDDSFIVAVSMNHPDRLFRFNLNQ